MTTEADSPESNGAAAHAGALRVLRPIGASIARRVRAGAIDGSRARRRRGGGRWRSDEGVHLAPLSTGEGPPVDVLLWCAELGAALQTARLLAGDARRSRRGRRSEAAMAALRDILAALDRPITGDIDALGVRRSADRSVQQPDFAFAVHDVTAGLTFTPWTDGLAVGFKCAGAGRRDQYLYLVPSDGHVGDGGIVSLHRGTSGVPGYDHAVHRCAVGASGASRETAPPTEPTRSTPEPKSA